MGISAYVHSTRFGLDVNSTSHNVFTMDVEGQVRVYSPGHNLTVDATGNGEGTVDADHGEIAGCASGGGTCVDGYADGDTVTLSATPGAHSAFTGWSVEGDPGADCSDAGSDCTVTLDDEVTVHANFVLTQHTLSVVKDGGGTGAVTSDPVGIDCGATCAADFDEGSDVTLQAVATGPSTFVGWSGGGCSGTSDCTVTMDDATTVHAQFTQPQPLTVVKDGTGTGSVSSSPAGIDCGATCGPVEFPEGDDVTLSATPNAHQSFDGWSGGGCSGTSDCVVPMDGATTVHATFTQITHSVSVSKDGTGSGTVTSAPAGINCGGTCSAPFNEAEDVVLTAAPAVHSEFTGWAGCDTPSGNQCTVDVATAENVTATFTLIQRNLNVTVDGNGAGKVDADFGAIADCTDSSGTCTDSQIEGASITLTATPANSHSSVSWTDCPFEAGNTCTVTLNSDTDVTATFSLDSHSLAVSKTGSGSGSVSCDGGACAASYLHGTSVTLSAAAASGSTFTGWSGAGCSGTGNCVVDLSSDKSVSANFNANPVAKAPDTCETNPALCPVATKPKLTYGKCVKNANKTYKKLLKKAKKKKGKARAKAIKKAKRKRGKLVNRCKVRFHKKGIRPTSATTSATGGARQHLRRPRARRTRATRGAASPEQHRSPMTRERH